MAEIRDKISKFLELVDEINTIIDSTLTWEEKYHSVFDARVFIIEMNMEPEWNDPDCTYEDDVLSYVRALNEKADRFRSIQW